MSRVSDAVRELLATTGTAKTPVDVNDIAEYLGLILVHTDLPDDVSGMLIRDGDNNTVGINKSHHIHRQRFTLAHEIGHFQLHRGRPLIVDSPVRVNLRDRTSGMATDREEIEANMFAAELLMPTELVFDAASRTRHVDMADFQKLLAEKFKVSPDAMGYRLVNLGIVS
jgi:Zn-dependent peptidase ImmA (M78 family)